MTESYTCGREVEFRKDHQRFLFNADTLPLLYLNSIALPAGTTYNDDKLGNPLRTTSNPCIDKGLR